MTPGHDEEFLRLVRQHLEPLLLDAGFVFNEAAVGAGPVTAPLVRESGWRRLSRLLPRLNGGKASARARTMTSVLHEADAQEFAAAYPRSEEHPEEPDCKDLWLHYDAATGSVDIDLQGEHLDLGDSASVVNDVSRSMAERVVALTGAVKRFLAEASATPDMLVMHVIRACSR
jgi:hypothetical protein